MDGSLFEVKSLDVDRLNTFIRYNMDECELKTTLNPNGVAKSVIVNHRWNTSSLIQNKDDNHASMHVDPTIDLQYISLTLL